jgi:hypothetical protein
MQIAGIQIARIDGGGTSRMVAVPAPAIMRASLNAIAPASKPMIVAAVCEPKAAEDYVLLVQREEPISVTARIADAFSAL